MDQLPSRLMTWDERYRLYLDESGDHVFKRLDEESHRYLCLLGCWFRGLAYRPFHKALEQLKQAHFPHSPDEPLVLHRKDLINRRGVYGRLRDPLAGERFDSDLLALIKEAAFRIVAVVVDKKALADEYGTAAAHPYHLAMGFMLQRYCGFLNHINRIGDVLAESRGGTEDRLLKDSYARVYERGAWMVPAAVFQQALTSREVKVKPKTANIAGLQLADILGHPVRQSILIERGKTNSPLGPFAAKLLAVVNGKFNRHLYNGRVEGYGKIMYPK